MKVFRDLSEWGYRIAESGFWIFKRYRLQRLGDDGEWVNITRPSAHWIDVAAVAELAISNQIERNVNTVTDQVIRDHKRSRGVS